LLLATAGAPIVSVDDDTICDTARLDAIDTTVRWCTPELRSASHPSELWCYADRDRACAGVVREDADFLGIHETLLGRRFVGGGDAGAGTVRVSFTGLFGDSGWGSPSFYLLLTGASLDRIVMSEHRYRDACLGRGQVKAVPTWTVMPRLWNMMGTFFGLDNRVCLGPFISVSRGCDVLYGTTVSTCGQGALFGFAPWMICHLPVESRSFWPGEVLRSSTGVDVSTVLGALMKRAAAHCDAATTEARLQTIGGELATLAAGSPDSFAAAARTAVREELGFWLADLQAQLDQRAAAPRFWADDLEAFLARLRTTMTRADVAVPLELHRAGAEAGALMQRLTLRFGQLMAAWPALLEAASELRRADLGV